MVLIANTVVMDADSLVYASGRVEMTREDVISTCDTAALDGSHEFARLMRTPVIKSRGKNPFTLYGTVIDLFGGGKQLHRVLAQGGGEGGERQRHRHVGHARLPDGERRARADVRVGPVARPRGEPAVRHPRRLDGRALPRPAAARDPRAAQGGRAEHSRHHEVQDEGEGLAARRHDLRALRQPPGHEGRLGEAAGAARSSSRWGTRARTTRSRRRTPPPIGPAINYVRGGRVAIAFRDASSEDGHRGRQRRRRLHRADAAREEAEAGQSTGDDRSTKPAPKSTTP